MNGEIIQERVWIPGTRGRLCGELSYPVDIEGSTALVFNPHPLMGGRMDNNVISSLARGLSEYNITVLRFDYSGVGSSEGPQIDIAREMNQFWATGCAPQDTNFVDDGHAVKTWLADQVGTPIFLIGYSFGAHAAAQASDESTPGILLISPTLDQHDFTPVEQSMCPIKVIYSDNDFATSISRFERWAAQLGPRASGQRIDAANHFFRGLEEEVTRACAEWIGQQELSGAAPE